jgi:alpha-galactosidase
LPGRYRDPTQTRAQVLRHGLEALRQTAGEETFLLGCGCPLGSAIGLVDAMRIGADVAPRWRPFYLGTEFYFQAEPDMPSARNAIQNDLTRAPLHRRWWINDPDCLLIRQDSRLNLAEVQSLATVIALSGGMLLLSDDLSQVSPERLRIARTLLPLIGERPRLPDWFDAATPRCMRLDLNGACGEWRLLALFNWGDRPQEATLRVADYDLEPGLAYWGREFWSGQIHSFSKGEVDLGRLPTHSVALLALRQVLPDQPRYLGGDLHVSQGQEVAAWNWQAATQELRLRLERPGRTAGHIDLALPSAPEEARLNGAPLVWDPVAKGCYRFSVEFESVAELKLIMEG